MEALAAEFLNIPEGYNSDDDLPPAEPKPTYQLGLRTIEQIFKNAIENRAQSKKRLRDHRKVAAAPGTQAKLQRWENIFGAFMQTLGLSTIKSSYGDKAIPSVTTVESALSCLSSVFINTYKDFKLTAHEASRIESLISGLVKEGLLYKGRWKRYNRVGFRTVLVMADAWLMLGVVLIAAFASRSGDIVRSDLYKGMEVLTFADLTLKYHGGTEMRNLTMQVCLRFVKCYKDLKNVDRNLTVDVLDDDRHNSVCAVKLLIIHALRIGAVSANSWTDLRAQILGRADQTLQWATPDRAVIPAIIPGHCSFLDLNKPACTAQVGSTIHEMSIKAKIIGQMTPHDLRRGSVADMAHLPAGSLRGNATMDVAIHVGHSMGSFNRGLTATYAGPADISTWNLRAQNAWVDRRAPRTASYPFIPTPMTKQDVSAYADARGLDASDQLVITQARKFTRKQQEAAWRESARNEPAGVVSSIELPGGRRVLAAVSSARINAVLPLQVIDLPIDPRLLDNSKALVLPSVLPILTDLSSEDMSINLNEEESENVGHILQVLTGTLEESAEDISDTSEEAQQALLLATLEDLDFGVKDPPHPLYCSPERFIDNFSKINIVRNTAAGKLSKEKFAKQVGTFVAQGNSRDAATQYIYYCPNEAWGCSFQSTNKESMGYHSLSCKISEDNPVAPDIYSCRRENCDRSFKTGPLRAVHESDHDYTPRQCHLGCTDEKWFTTKNQWTVHKSRKHDAEWDTSMNCHFPECTRTNFPNRAAYSKHLSKTHKLRGLDLKQYVPQLTHRDPVFGKRSCPFPDCPRAAPGKEFDGKKKLEAHLRSKIGGHECAEDEIEELMDGMYSLVDSSEMSRTC